MIHLNLTYNKVFKNKRVTLDNLKAEGGDFPTILFIIVLLSVMHT